MANVASSSNGRTADSDSVNLGSSPGEAANVCKSSEMTTFSFICRAFSEFEIDIVTCSICVTAEIRECNECHVRYEKSIKRDNLQTFLIKKCKTYKAVPLAGIKNFFKSTFSNSSNFTFLAIPPA